MPLCLATHPPFGWLWPPCCFSRKNCAAHSGLGWGLPLRAVLIVGTDFFKHPTLGFGNLLASTAAIFYAAYQLITRRGRVHIDPFRYTWLVGVSATITM